MEEVTSLKASHEEADDRIMFTIQQLYSKDSSSSTTVVTPDADIFVGLLYHLKNSWSGMELFLFKKGNIKGNRSDRIELHPLHLLLPKISPAVVDNLPAGHSLTGCDTVAKISTKKNLLNSLDLHGKLITEFGKDRLDEDIIQQAEAFLVKLVCTKSENFTSFDELRASRYHRNLEKRFVDLPCTSAAIHQNIR